MDTETHTYTYTHTHTHTISMNSCKGPVMIPSLNIFSSVSLSLYQSYSILNIFLAIIPGWFVCFEEKTYNNYLVSPKNIFGFWM